MGAEVSSVECRLAVGPILTWFAVLGVWWAGSKIDINVEGRNVSWFRTG